MFNLKRFGLAHRNAQKLLQTLLGLQENFLDQVDDGGSGMVTSDHLKRDCNSSVDDEEIPSDTEEEEEREEEVVAEQTSALTKSRKRKRSPSVVDGNWEVEFEALQKRLRPYRDSVISKWNEKTRLASGKITSKVSRYCRRSLG